MIVMIPSYKRTDILHWVIQSVVSCDTQGIDERILILIINNYFPKKETVDSIVNQIKHVKKIEIEVIHREKTLPAVDSWFSAMFSKSVENEVVVLLGDDDILLPWGLKNRYQQITKHKADMLLSDFCQRLYFFHQGEFCWCNFQMPIKPFENKEAVSWDYSHCNHPNPTFMSNHCYRNTAGFRRGLEKAMSWCDAQNWVPRDFATGNLPGYLSYAIKSSGGVVVSISETSVIRGSLAEESQFQDYSDGGNSSFYSLLIYNTFSNTKLHGNVGAFEEWQKIHLHCFITSIFGILFNKKISIKVLHESMLQSKLKFRNLITWDILKNYQICFKLLPGVRGYRLRQISKSKELCNTKEFIHNLVKS